MKVLHVIDGLGPGGAEALLYRLVSRPSEIEHEVVCIADRDWYSDDIERSGVRVHHLRKYSYPLVAAALAQLHGLIKRSGADVVQGWLYRSNILSSLAAFGTTVPVVWGIHCSSLNALRLSSRLMVKASGPFAPWLADYIVNCSVKSAEIHAELGYGRVAGAVVYNGYDAAAFHPDDAARLQTRMELGVVPETFLIGSITRWHPYKAVPDLLRALRIVLDRGVPARCLLIGRGLTVHNHDLGREIIEVGCGLNMLRLGERPDIPQLARALDLHVLSSLTEAFPNVVAESMLSGTPNIATSVGDTELMMGGTGWAVPPGDPERLADAITEAYRIWRVDRSQWEKRRTAARERIAEHFTFERMADAYEEVWRKVARNDLTAIAAAAP